MKQNYLEQRFYYLDHYGSYINLQEDDKYLTELDIHRDFKNEYM